MTELVTIADLSGLATRINDEHRQCEAALKMSLDHAVSAGRLLIQAKAAVPHGEWGEWLRDNFTGSERTAQIYMRVARDLPALVEANPQRVADLSLRDAVALIAAPLDSNDDTDVVAINPPAAPENWVPSTVLVGETFDPYPTPHLEHNPTPFTQDSTLSRPPAEETTEEAVARQRKVRASHRIDAIHLSFSYVHRARSAWGARDDVDLVEDLALLLAPRKYVEHWIEEVRATREWLDRAEEILMRESTKISTGGAS